VVDLDPVQNEIIDWLQKHETPEKKHQKEVMRMTSTIDVSSSMAQNAGKREEIEGGEEGLTEWFKTHDVSVDDIPWNCPRSREARVFVCQRRAKVLHFMVSAHRGPLRFLQFYAGFWDMFGAMSWNILVKP